MIGASVHFPYDSLCTLWVQELRYLQELRNWESNGLEFLLGCETVNVQHIYLLGKQ